MASTYTTRLRLEKQATGENSNTWGDRLNASVIDMIDEAITGYTIVSVSSATVSLTANNGSTDQSRSAFLEVQGVLTSSIDIAPPVSVSKGYWVRNATSGSFTVTMKQGGGTGVAVPQGDIVFVICDGTSVRRATDSGLTQTSASLIYVQLSAANTITGANTLTSTADFQGSVSVGGAFTASGASRFLATTSVSTLDISGVARGRALVTITYAASTTIDFSLGNDFIVSLTGNITFVTATNVKPGQSGCIYLSQDGTGSRTGAFVTMFNFPSSTAPTLSTTASTTDMIAYNIRTSTDIDCVTNTNMG